MALTNIEKQARCRERHLGAEGEKVRGAHSRRHHQGQDDPPGTPQWLYNNRAGADLIGNAAVEGDRRTVEADLGTVRYLATLLGADDEAVLRWFILAVALLPDPAAVLLLLAASSRR